MVDYCRFVWRSFRISLVGDWRYHLWMAILTIVALVGLNAYAKQLVHGLGVTGMTDQVSWGLYIANFTFLVGMAAAAVMLVIPVYIYRNKELHDLVIFGELLAVAAVVMALLFVVVDMGRPDRFHHLFLKFNFPMSMLAWDVIVLNGYLLLNSHICGYLVYCAYRKRPPTRAFYIPFVFLAIFAHFGIRNEDQHRVLFWGVLGALVMRMIFIAAGAALLERFTWMIFVFGGFLVYTGVMMGIGKKGDVDPESSRLLRFAVRRLRTTKTLHGQRFLVRENGALVATPLLLVLVLVELSDVLFAFDSVPAVLGITADLFIVYTSNVFAILGLRALYFLLTGAVARLQYLDKGLALVLAFIGGKMVASPWVHIPVWASLAVVFAILGATVAASLMTKPPPAEAG